MSARLPHPLGTSPVPSHHQSPHARPDPCDPPGWGLSARPAGTRSTTAASGRQPFQPSGAGRSRLGPAASPLLRTRPGEAAQGSRDELLSCSTHQERNEPMVGSAGGDHGYTGVLAATLSSAELLVLDLMVVAAAALFAIAASLTVPRRDQPPATEAPTSSGPIKIRESPRGRPGALQDGFASTTVRD